MFCCFPVTIGEDEDGPSDAELSKGDSVSKISNELQRVKKNMKTHLEMYKTAEGEKAKQAALVILKKLTAEKKKLEGLL